MVFFAFLLCIFVIFKYLCLLSDQLFRASVISTYIFIINKFINNYPLDEKLLSNFQGPNLFR